MASGMSEVIKQKANHSVRQQHLSFTTIKVMKNIALFSLALVGYLAIIHGFVLDGTVCAAVSLGASIDLSRFFGDPNANDSSNPLPAGIHKGTIERVYITDTTGHDQRPATYLGVHTLQSLFFVKVNGATYTVSEFPFASIIDESLGNEAFNYFSRSMRKVGIPQEQLAPFAQAYIEHLEQGLEDSDAQRACENVVLDCLASLQGTEVQIRSKKSKNSQYMDYSLAGLATTEEVPDPEAAEDIT